jgi:hypothetical protein
MVKTVGKLRSELDLDKSKYEKGLKGAKKSTQGFANFLKKAGKIMAAIFAVKIIFQWTKALKNAYQTQMEAEIKLQTIMRQRMGLGKAAVNDLKKQAQAYQRIGVIGDEVQLAGLQQLATFMRQKESLEALLPAMNNLLAQQRGYNAKATDAVGIANLMGKVMEGQVSALRRVGISFSEAQAHALKFGTELEKAEVLSAVITGNVGETNKALGKTPLGKIKKWQNAWGDFKEMLGGKIVPLLGQFATWGMKTLPKISENFNGIRKRVVALANNFIDLYNESMFFRQAVETIGATFKTLSTIVKGVFDGIILMTKGAGQLLKDIFMGNWKNLGDNADKVMVEVFENFKKMGQDVGDHWEKRMENITKKKYVQYIEIKAASSGDTGTDFDRAPSMSKIDSIGTQPLIDEEAMNRLKQGNEEIQEAMQQTEYQALSLGGVFGDVWQGMADSITNALGESENIFKAFWKFFTDFIKGMIIKLVAATIAALALAVVLSFIGMGAGVGKLGMSIAKMGTFGDIFKSGFGKMAGIPGMAKGGTVPPGYPNDTYPAFLSSGETVLTPEQSQGLGMGVGKMEIVVKTDFTDGEQMYWIVENYKRRSNISY